MDSPTSTYTVRVISLLLLLSVHGHGVASAAEARPMTLSVASTFGSNCTTTTITTAAGAAATVGTSTSRQSPTGTTTDVLDEVNSSQIIYILGSSSCERDVMAKALDRLGFRQLALIPDVRGRGKSSTSSTVELQAARNSSNTTSNSSKGRTSITTPDVNSQSPTRYSHVYTSISTPLLVPADPRATYILVTTAVGRGDTKSQSQKDATTTTSTAAAADVKAATWREALRRQDVQPDRWLELSVTSAASSGAQAERWQRLCVFLGLGYSTVERLKLWHFP